MEGQKRNKQSIQPGTFKRLLGFILDHYKARMVVVVICIISSAVASTAATVFMQRLIDECITPGISLGMNAVWEQLVSILTAMAIFYLFGVAASFIYTRLMATVTQGTLKN